VVRQVALVWEQLVTVRFLLLLLVVVVVVVPLKEVRE
jgi:hypothetical protein